MSALQETSGSVDTAMPREIGVPGKPDGKPHWRALDGVRAVAIMSVMVYHLEHRYLLPGGYLGVDVFFVLSGFLITSLLVAEREGNDGRVSFRNFYARRVLRLGPALVCALIAAIVLAEIDGGLRGRYTIEMVPWVVVYLGNWAQFFGDSGPGNYLGNTWSLAIEEQFYLVWPLLFVFACSHVRSRRTLTLLLFGFGASAMIYRELITRFTAGGYSRVYLGTTDTHVDGLIVGCGLAFLLARQGAIGRRFSRAVVPLMWVGAGAVVLLIVFAGYSPTWTMITYPSVVVATALVLGRARRRRAEPAAGRSLHSDPRVDRAALLRALPLPLRPLQRHLGLLVPRPGRLRQDRSQLRGGGDQLSLPRAARPATQASVRDHQGPGRSRRAAHPGDLTLGTRRIAGR